MKFKFLIFHIFLKISFRVSFCLAYVNHVCPTNKLQLVHTLHCTLYTVHYAQYRAELSTPETSQESGHI